MNLATRILRRPCLVLACTALSACLGSSTSGGGGSGAPSLTPAAYEEAYERTFGKGPTTNMPTAGSANFAGATLVDLHQGRTQIGQLMGDIEMSIDFAAANDAARQNDAMRGKVFNIRGKIGPQEVEFDGDLTTADAKSKGLTSKVSTTSTSIDLPIIGSTTTRTGTVVAHFSGDLALGDDTGAVVLQLNGNFTGPGAQGIVGSADGTWFAPGNPEAFTVDGSFFADRK